MGRLGAPFVFNQSGVIFGVDDGIEASGEGDSSEGVSIAELAVEKDEFYGQVVDFPIDVDGKCKCGSKLRHWRPSIN